jgi:hypothetical protein
LIFERREAEMIGPFSNAIVRAPRNPPESAKKSAALRILIVDDEF